MTEIDPGLRREDEKKDAMNDADAANDCAQRHLWAMIRVEPGHEDALRLQGIVTLQPPSIPRTALPLKGEGWVGVDAANVRMCEVGLAAARRL
jgi:hypothetical protein